MTDRPNILLIMSDQHNKRVMGCAGDPVVRTPNLDRLAQQGMRFTNCYTPSPLCVPGRMAFLTGRMPSEQRVWCNSCILDSNIPTFAHSLSNAGYETVLCGRMHFVGQDQHHGFEHRLVGSFTGQLPGAGGPGIPDSLKGGAGQERSAVEIAGCGNTLYQEYDRQVSAAAVDFFNKRDQDKPFAMVVGYVLPHCPFVCREDLYEEYYQKLSNPELPEGHFDALHSFVQKWRIHRGITDLTDEEIRKARAAYYGLVTMLDENIGRVLDGLEQAGLKDDTLVIYTSDHGEMAGDHGMWWKSSFCEGSVSVPFIASRPDSIPQGCQSDRVISLIDVGPTLSEAADAQQLPDVRGRSFKAFLEQDGEVPDWPDEVFSEHYPARGDRASVMIRSGKWKMNLYNGYEHVQLFNLDEDPGEWHDLGEVPEHAVLINELTAKIRAWWDGDRVEAEYKRLMQDVDVLVRWGRTVKPDTPYQWVAPEGCNTYDTGRER